MKAAQSIQFIGAHNAHIQPVKRSASRQVAQQLMHPSFNQHMQMYFAAVSEVAAANLGETMTLKKNLLISEIIQYADVFHSMRSSSDHFSQQFIAMLRVTKPFIVKELMSRIMQVVEFEIGEIVLTGLYERMHFWISQFKTDYNCNITADAVLKCVNWKYLAIPIAAGQQQIGFVATCPEIFEAQCILTVMVDRDEGRLTEAQFKKMFAKFNSSKAKKRS